MQNEEVIENHLCFVAWVISSSRLFQIKRFCRIVEFTNVALNLGGLLEDERVCNPHFKIQILGDHLFLVAWANSTRRVYDQHSSLDSVACSRRPCPLRLPKYERVFNPQLANKTDYWKSFVFLRRGLVGVGVLCGNKTFDVGRWFRSVTLNLRALLEYERVCNQLFPKKVIPENHSFCRRVFSLWLCSFKSDNGIEAVGSQSHP